MKKSVISMIVLGLVAVVVVGCSTAAKGPSDQELVNKLVADWKAAATAKDLDKDMTFYSDKFSHDEYGDKAGMKAFMKEAIDMGYLENADFNSANAKVTIEKDAANVYPINLKAAFGSAAVRLNLKKEAAGWMIVGMDIEQM
jgi:ketosteroid isomerase-like protein